MEPKDYRKQIEDQLAAEAKQDSAARSADPADSDEGESLQELIDTLANEQADAKARVDALTRVEAGSFDVEAFAKVKASYLAALRTAAESKDDTLRECATASLAQNKDRSVQTSLVAGLRDPAKATLPPEVALQLLSHDIHAEVQAVAREIVAKPPSDEAKVEAIRLLASDSEAEELVKQVLRSKSESVEARQAAATALQALSTKGFCKEAVEVVADEDDEDEVRAGVLAGLAQLDEFMEDDEVRDAVQRVHSATASEALKEQTKAHLERTGDEEARARHRARKSRRQREP